MTNPRRRAKLKNPSRKITRRTANKHEKKLNILGNKIISANWDKKKTLHQNYDNLGLRTRLNGIAGGTEKRKRTIDTIPASPNLTALPEDEEEIRKILRPDQGYIKRDAEGNVIKVIVGKEKSLDEVIDEEIKPTPAKTDVVKQLEESAAGTVKVERHQSEFEEVWVTQLIAKYGDDYQAMFWDKKLNPYQQTAAQLKKKIQNYLKKRKSR